MRILIVDDHVEFCEILAEILLADGGHEVAIAHSVSRAFEVARQLRPVLVLCDLNFPGGDTGVELARRLRSDPFTSAMYLVAITGDPDRSGGELRAGGFDAVLQKPMPYKVVKAIVQGLA
jgi:CheY-like chemotaxis protein